jgi:hypothetical protein
MSGMSCEKEAGTVGHSDSIEIIEAGARFLDSALHNGDDAREVRARGDLGHHSAKNLVDVLRENDERLLRDVVTLTFENRG